MSKTGSVSKVSSVTFSGINARIVDVEVSFTQSIPKFVIVGLADKTIAESKERVESALAAIGFALPAQKILVSLSPADLVKEGSHFDLAIAVAILANCNILPKSEIKDYVVVGELSLNGDILPVTGVLPAAIEANIHNLGLICPDNNSKEASWSGNESIIAPKNLLSLINHFKGTQVISLNSTSSNLHDDIDICLNKSEDQSGNKNVKHDISDINQQYAAKRALEIAAAGNHNLLMSGPPGSGKSMLASRLITILPKLSVEQILECSMIASVAGNIIDGALINDVPFRAPHHSCTNAAMVGGGVGRKVKPGEISLAHNGVLFLDELPEFQPNVIEALRQPIETGEVYISRSANHIKYPAKFQLIAAMNPCKCGNLNDPMLACSKAPKCAQSYKGRISGPILDRFDIHIDVNNDHFEGYISENISVKDDALTEDSSANIAKRVKSARAIQYERYKDYKSIYTNRDLEGDLLIKYALPVDDGLKILNDATKKFKLSYRSYNKVLKVARTIADLNDEEKVQKIHIAEALSYRQHNLIS